MTQCGFASNGYTCRLLQGHVGNHSEVALPLAQRDTEFTTVDNMLRYGGGFVKALAKAVVRADDDNYQRLRQAFPELWQHYGPQWHGMASEVLLVGEHWQVTYGNTLTTPQFPNRGDAEVYAHELRRGARQPEYGTVA